MLDELGDFVYDISEEVFYLFAETSLGQAIIADLLKDVN